MDLHVASLHRLPFDVKGFAKNMEAVADHDAQVRAELEVQYRENWDNAWIIVVEYPKVAELDYSRLAHPLPGPNAQAPWLERDLDLVGDSRRAAFFMHYIEQTKPLWYGDQALEFPEVTKAPESLIEMMEYCSPD